MEVKVTTATVIALVFTNGISSPARVDDVKTFTCAGEPSMQERSWVLDVAAEMVQECTDQLSEEEIYDVLLSTSMPANKTIVWDDGSVTIRWETEV